MNLGRCPLPAGLFPDQVVKTELGWADCGRDSPSPTSTSSLGSGLHSSCSLLGWSGHAPSRPRPNSPPSKPRPWPHPSGRRGHAPETHLCRPGHRHSPWCTALVRGSISLPASVSVWVSVFLGPCLRVHISVCVSPVPSCFCVSVSLCNPLPVSESLGLYLSTFMSLSLSLSASLCFSLHLSPPLLVSQSIFISLPLDPSTFLCLLFSSVCTPTGRRGTLPSDFHLLLRLWRGLDGPWAPPCGLQGTIRRGQRTEG